MSNGDIIYHDNKYLDNYVNKVVLHNLYNIARIISFKCVIRFIQFRRHNLIFI